MDCEVARYLDRRRKLKDNKYPIRIRIYHKGIARFINTNYRSTPGEFKSLPRETNKSLTALESRVRSICLGIKTLDIELIRKLLDQQVEPQVAYEEPVIKTTPVTTDQDILPWFIRMLNLLHDEERYASKQCYAASMTFYKGYTKQDTIPFTYFTKTRLKKIQADAIKSGSSISTVGKHARNLRAVFNLAINTKGSGVSKDVYPFGRYGYVIPQVTKRKKSLSRKSLSTLINFKTQDEKQQRAVAYFIFSFFGNGMNMKDIAMLKQRNIVGKILSFYREKTINTSVELKEIRLAITPEMRAIIHLYGIPGGPDDFVFPILRKTMTTLQVFYKIKEFTKDVNHALRDAVKSMGLSERITFGMARHTFGNALKQEGVTTDRISEMFGHSSTTVTEHYLNSLEDEIIFSFPDKLRAFYTKP